MATLKEWFCLSEDRKSFKPQVLQDRQEIFCHQREIDDAIRNTIERQFAAGEPIKMMLWGDWGVGKTHAVNHIAWWLEQNQTEYPAEAIIVELSDVTKKSRFDVLTRSFLDRLTLPRIIELIHEYQPKTGVHIVDGLAKVDVVAHVAEAFSKLLLARKGDSPPPDVLTAFEYLKGGKGGANIGLGQPLTTSEEFYGVLLALGEVHRKTTGRLLVFVCDEAAKLEDVDKDDASRQHWTSVNRLIFDDRNDVFGFIYTMSGKGERHLAKVLLDNQVLSRLGESNLIELRNLAQGDVDSFLTNLVSRFVDKPCVDAKDAAGALGPGYDWAAYPFTPAARHEFIMYWSTNPEAAKPRDICDKLNDVAFQALKRSKGLIDEECLREVRLL